MTPRLLQAFLDWLVRRIAEALAEEQGAPVRESTVLTSRVDGQVSTRQGNRIRSGRQSNLNARPGTPLATTRLSPDRALGDTNRQSPPVGPPQGGVPLQPVRWSPPAFASLAVMIEYRELYDASLTGYLLPDRALPPDASTGVADWPTNNDVREKLWRQRNLRGSANPDWAEWDHLTQDYPEGTMLYTGGVAAGEPHVTGIRRRDWPYVTVTDIMPASTSGGKWWLPDNIGWTSWVFDETTFEGSMHVVPPRLTIDGTTWEPYAASTTPLYSVTPHTLMASRTVPRDVVRYARSGETIVNTVDYLEREMPVLNDDGIINVDEDGTLTLTAGEVIAGPGPAWWDTSDPPAGTVDADTTGTTIPVTITSNLRTYLQDHDTFVRFYRPSDPGPVGVRRVTSVNTSPDELVLDASITVEAGDEVQAYQVGVPKSGSRTWYVHDEITITWDHYTLLQAHRDTTNPNILTYRWIPGRTVQVDRRLRLHDGNDGTAPILQDFDRVGTPHHGFGDATTDADGFESDSFALDHPGYAFVVGGASWSTAFETSPTLAGTLDGATFLADTPVPVRHYRMTTPIVLTTYEPLPGEDAYETFLYRRRHEDREPYRTYLERVNPLIYDGPLGTLPNPMSNTTGGTWCGMNFTARWYCADALTARSGETIGLLLLDDLTIMVSRAGTLAWTGSLWSLLPGCGGSIPVEHREDGAPTAWPTGRTPAFQVAPHYNFTHPSWPFPMGMLSIFAVRERVGDDRAGLQWAGARPPVVAYPLV